MREYHSNTVKLRKIIDDAIECGWAKKHPYRDFAYEVAEEAKELGNDFPSDTAIKIALQKLKSFIGEDDISK